MRHRNSGRKLGRNSSHRNAMFRNMVTSLINEERIETTVPKAKELRPIIEKLLTSAKHNAPSLVEAAADDQKASKVAGRVAAIRQAGKYVRGKDALQKLFGELSEKYHSRNGGYTRIVRTRNRLGDNAEMAIIELIQDAGTSVEG
jgi:large subunit ribosomal protein L17